MLQTCRFHPTYEGSAPDPIKQDPFANLPRSSLTLPEIHKIRDNILRIARSFSDNSKHDISALVGQVRAAGVSISGIEDQPDLKALPMLRTLRILNEIADALIFPAGEILVINFIGAPEIYHGRINTRTWARIDYLPGHPVWYADADFHIYPPEHFGLSVGPYAFVDRVKSLADNKDMFIGLSDPRSPLMGIPYAKILQAEFKARGIGADDYARVFGYNRLKHQEINNSRDHIFAKAISGHDRDPYDLSGEVMQIIRPGSVLHQALTTNMKGQRIPHLSAAGIIGFSAESGGLMDEMNEHIDAGKPELACCAFLDFMMMNAIKTALESSPRVPRSATRHFKTATLFDLAFEQQGFSSSLEVLQAVIGGAEAPGVGALKLVKKVHDEFLLTHEERLVRFAEKK